MNGKNKASPQLVRDIIRRCGARVVEAPFLRDDMSASQLLEFLESADGQRDLDAWAKSTTWFLNIIIAARQECGNKDRTIPKFVVYGEGDVGLATSDPRDTLMKMCQRLLEWESTLLA